MLTINALTYRLGGRLLLDGASLVVRDGARIGLVGRNGTGKSTLFRLILGEIGPEAGDIELGRGARIGTVAQEAPGGPQSLIDFVLEADRERTDLLAEAEAATDPTRIAEIHTRLADIDAHTAPARAARILDGLGFDEDAQQRALSTYSGGWRMRVALAAVLFSEPDLLLLDEPSNYLDLEGTMWLESYLGRYPKSFLLISHDRDLLNNAVTDIAHLLRGRITVYRGGFDQFVRQKRERDALDQKAKKKQDAQRKHMEAFVERFRYKATKARQAQSRLKALAKLETIEIAADETSVPIALPSPKNDLSPPIVTISGGAVGYAPDNPVLETLDLRIDQDDRIGLLGANGNGKSTFAKLLTGALVLENGTIVRADKLRIGYFAQHQLDELTPEMSPFDQIRRRMPQASVAQVRGRVAQMGFGVDKAETPASKLSGGEKARLMLGLASFDAPHLLILDEPTNHLDMDAREQLVDALNTYSGAVILVSHDRHLIETTCDRLWLVADGTVRPYDADIETYRREVTSTGSSNRSGDKKRKEASAKAETSAETAKPRQGHRRVDEIEERIRKLEEGIARIDTELADPYLFARRPARGAELSKLRSDAQKLLDKAEEDWLALSAELENRVEGA